MLFTNQVPKTNMRINYLFGEIKELFEEIRIMNLKGIRNEACDVYTVAMCCIETYTGIPMPILWKRSAHAWLERLTVWKNIFKEEAPELEFKSKYLVNGGNYEKRWKIDAALDLARKDQL